MKAAAPTTPSTLSSVRCHSIKGGAGIFGFETLVQNCACVSRPCSIPIRSGVIAITPDNIDTLLAAGDVLADLVNMSRTEEGPPADYGAECRAALEEIMRQKRRRRGRDRRGCRGRFRRYRFHPSDGGR